MKQFALRLPAMLIAIVASAQSTHRNSIWSATYNASVWLVNDEALDQNPTTKYLTTFTSKRNSDVITVTVLPESMSVEEYFENQLRNNSIYSGKVLTPFSQFTLGDKKVLFGTYEYNNSYGSSDIAAWFFALDGHLFQVVYVGFDPTDVDGTNLVTAIKVNQEAKKSGLTLSDVIHKYNEYDHVCSQGKGEKLSGIMDIYARIDENAKTLSLGSQVVDNDAEKVSLVKRVLEERKEVLTPKDSGSKILIDNGYTITYYYYDYQMNCRGSASFNASNVK